MTGKGNQDEKDTRILVLNLEKETKGTFRYEEETEDKSPPVIGSLYLKKWFTGKNPPRQYTVSISPKP